jgi:hypothetical protein
MIWGGRRPAAILNGLVLFVKNSPGADGDEGEFVFINTPVLSRQNA